MFVKRRMYFLRIAVKNSTNAYSYILTLNLSNIRLDQAGKYTCKATSFEGIDESQEIEIAVSGNYNPIHNDVQCSHVLQQ